MRSYRIEGIIIKRRNVGEADRVLTVFTKEYGKIQVKASGVRRVPSKRAAHVELLNHVTLYLHKGKNVPIVTEAIASEVFSSLKENLTSIGFAYHICEIVDGLCPENQENKRVFDLLINVLLRLATEEDKERLVRSFERELLIRLGFSSSTEAAILDTGAFIEQVMERRLKTKRLLSHFSS